MHGLLEKLAYLTIPAEPVHQAPVLLDERLLATPAVAIQRAREIAGKMARASLEAMETAMELTDGYSQEKMDRVQALETETDRYEDALGTYLVQLTRQELSEHDNRSLNTILYTLSDLERHHHLRISEEALKEAVRLSVRYLPDLYLPDKAIDLLDEGAARARMEEMQISKGGAARKALEEELHDAVRRAAFLIR